MNYNNLDLNLLKVFVNVYEHKNILRASKKLYISQPAITKSIKKLEEFLGGSLFVRTSKGVIPTREGEEFYKYCINSLEYIDNGIKNFSNYINLEKGYLEIGSSSTIIRRILLPFIDEFSKKYPKIKISVTDAISDNLVKFTRSGKVDLSIMNEPIEDDEDFDKIKITTTTDCFIVAANFQKDFLTKEELKDYPLILQKRPSNNRDFFETLCIENNVSYTPNYELGSFGLITDFCEKGLGIAYTIKEFVQKDINNNRIKELKTDFQIRKRNVVVITSKKSINSFATKIFIKELQRFFNRVLNESN